MLTSDKKVVQLIIDQCYHHGVRNVVISPGSRNAPLSISFDEHPSIQTYVIHDERSAAFFALGMSEQLNQPVALCCTSGSAALNYYPAISEAYYRSIPLIVITADRPEAWINQGDGQTIMQQNVYNQHVHHYVQLQDAHFTDEQKWLYQRETAIGLEKALKSRKGPIHFNVSLSEPLYKTIEKQEDFSRKIEILPLKIDWTNEVKSWAKKGLSSQKIMVLCGQLTKSEQLQSALTLFSQHKNVAILVENTANLVHANFNHCIDRSLYALTDSKKEQLSPDLLITLGGAIVSKNIKTLLRENPPKQHWKIGTDFPGMDTYQCLSHEIQSEAALFFDKLNELDLLPIHSSYFESWKEVDVKKQDRSSDFHIESTVLSDIKVFQSLLKLLPNTSVLHMGNSSVIRYCQLFDPNHTIEYRCNRGTSGIDGSTSTAIGAAFVNPEKVHILISGDISFLYDSNGLWNKYLPKNLKIIVVNNYGGGIFRIIPGPANTKQLETFFEAKHNQNIAKIASAFNCDYTIIQDQSALNKELSTLLNKKGENLSLIEIVTDSNQNPLSLHDFLTFISQ
jgi:2-succinyl-5-enolpyruvyl-6-hydroxy-3-cyclohexene-1-carboxylate synthase